MAGHRERAFAAGRERLTAFPSSSPLSDWSAAVSDDPPLLDLWGQFLRPSEFKLQPPSFFPPFLSFFSLPSGKLKTFHNPLLHLPNTTQIRVSSLATLTSSSCVFPFSRSREPLHLSYVHLLINITSAPSARATRSIFNTRIRSRVPVSTMSPRHADEMSRFFVEIPPGPGSY